MSLTVKQITDLGAKQLEASGIADARRDSDTLYCYLVGVPESKLFTEYQYTLQEVLCDKYFDLIDRRASGEPLQYIVGTTEFMGLPFKVTPDVLIPRQDTETLVEDAISLMEDGTIRGFQKIEPKKTWEVLDLGTGSGAIGVSLARIVEKCTVTMSDISKAALGVAKENAKLNGVEKKVKFVEGDLFAPLGGILGTKKFDMIISNPPYIPTETIETLQREIKEHEPRTALDGGEDGLDCYRRIAESVSKHLKKDGVLLLEIGHDQKDAVTNILASAGVFLDIRCYQDLARHDRIILATS